MLAPYLMRVDERKEVFRAKLPLAQPLGPRDSLATSIGMFADAVKLTSLRKKVPAQPESPRPKLVASTSQGPPGSPRLQSRELELRGCLGSLLIYEKRGVELRSPVRFRLASGALGPAVGGVGGVGAVHCYVLPLFASFLVRCLKIVAVGRERLTLVRLSLRTVVRESHVLCIMALGMIASALLTTLGSDELDRSHDCGPCCGRLGCRRLCRRQVPLPERPRWHLEDEERRERVRSCAERGQGQPVVRPRECKQEALESPRHLVERKRVHLWRDVRRIRPLRPMDDRTGRQTWRAGRRVPH